MSCGCGCSGEVVAYEEWDEEDVTAAEYQGRKVTLNKPFRTKGASKKFAVYTKNGSGTVVIVRFGDPNMEIKRDDPARRKSFRSRHNCDSPGPKWKARYWSCRQWRGGTKVEASLEVCSDCETSEACAEHGSCMNTVEAAEPTPKDGETHDEFMSRCQKAGYSKEECMKAHEGHEFEVEGYKEEEEASLYRKKYASECGIDEEFVDGECRRIAVTIDLDNYELEAVVEASTGETIVKISGIAFHEGMNKNKWEITKAGAEALVSRMVGADVTLNHPPSNKHGEGFTRNMDGGVEDAIVGFIAEAWVEEVEGEKWNVRYIAHIVRSELFASLESGLWSREDYGVSIGGSGVPVSATDNGITFGEDFSFDHLAIVHRPAYPRANIEKVERIKSAEASKTFISHSKPHANQQPKEELKMTAEEIVENTSADEMESLKADLVMANARVAEFEAAENARVEAERTSLVEKATEIGMSGHEDLKTETLETLIASWEASHPEPEPVVMESVEDTPIIDTPVVASETAAPVKVVANYLNGVMVETEEDLYERAYNAWARAWNGTLDASESKIKAKMYADVKEMI